ncbi:MAG: hypothetical protein H6625_11965 [Bdellovibrionaceae bacterium]|nr:hypothetical protein [Pseudobdellovibrionaceae bacterium]
MFLFNLLKPTAWLVVLAALSVGCSGKNDSADSASSESLVISGALSSASVSSKPTLPQFSLSSQSISVSDLEVYGLAFSDPPEVQTVELGSDGSFTLTFSSAAAGAPISLIFRYDSASSKAGEQVGIVKFVDTSESDIDGNSSSSSSLALSGSVSLGNLNIDEDGNVEVPVAQISTNIANKEVTSSTAFNFSGDWTFKKYDGKLPSGYSHLCASGASDCHGPEANMPIHLARIVGKKFTPNSACSSAASNDTFNASSDTCSGTTGSDNRYMIQVWQSETAKNSCGNRLGFPNEAAKAYARIDFSSSGVTEGNFTWSSGFTDGWKDQVNARAMWDIRNCGPIEVSSDDNSKKIQGWKCSENGGTGGEYQVSLQGGCVDSSNNPVHVTDWQNINPSGCNETALSGFSNFKENSCSYSNQDPDGSGSLAAQNFTCKFAYGNFNSDGSPDTGNAFDWNDVASILNGDSNPSNPNNDGDLCSSITPSTDFETVAQLQCYADYLWRANLEDDDSKCIRKVETNWGATNPDDFILHRNGPERAMTLFVLAKFNYDSADSGYFEDEDIYFRGIQTGDSWTNCKVKERFRMSIKKRSSTSLVSEFLQETELLDKSKEACVADSKSSDGELQIGSSKTIMLLSK